MHCSVLLEESLNLLNIKKHGTYVDGTFGRGGHTTSILNSTDGVVLALDKDPDAISYGMNLHYKNLILVNANFADICSILAQNNIDKIDGVILDLGMSTPQLKDHKRGFSFLIDSAILDMRMNSNIGKPLHVWLNSASEQDIIYVLKEYGDERYAKSIARGIVNARSLEYISTVGQLVSIIKRFVRNSNKHPATRSFQAFRIHVNQELIDLEKFLVALPNILNIGGRAVIISFHSKEISLVRREFRKLCDPYSALPKWVNIQDLNAQYPKFKIVATKIRPSNQELLNNDSSRSACLNCIELISR